ncbi:hypothetical protein [uncultured Vagococcus sp.]|uniref:hypothetical protein n=1 Tax=uncultured Vagococcus sp. TaxID=189676 RepID=UPI0025889470|nr:hypothetical protein [uncultured Vagococcus sp.]
MDKKQVEQEEIEINKTIQQYETKMNDLRRERHQIQETFDNIQFDLRKSYQELTRLNQEESHFGGQDVIIAQQKEDEQALYIRRQLGQLQEGISQEYKQQVKLIEQETETLQKKRSELAWD